jgi:hypothetical protein
MYMLLSFRGRNAVQAGGSVVNVNVIYYIHAFNYVLCLCKYDVNRGGNSEVMFYTIIDSCVLYSLNVDYLRKFVNTFLFH